MLRLPGAADTATVGRLTSETIHATAAQHGEEGRGEWGSTGITTLAWRCTGTATTTTVILVPAIVAATEAAAVAAAAEEERRPPTPTGGCRTKQRATWDIDV